VNNSPLIPEVFIGFKILIVIFHCIKLKKGADLTPFNYLFKIVLP